MKFGQRKLCVFLTVCHPLNPCAILHSCALHVRLLSFVYHSFHTVIFPLDDSPKPASATPQPPEIDVDETHEEVKVIVDKAIKLAEEHPINLPAEVSLRQLRF